MFEHHSQELLPKAQFFRRILWHSALTFVIVLAALSVGVLGYCGFEGLSWVDSLLNASMILGGMGPVDPMTTIGGKLFASSYALFSGVLFLVVAGVLSAPILHRFLHRFHLELDEEGLAEKESDE